MNSQIFSVNFLDFIRGLVISGFAGGFAIIATALQSAISTGILSIDWHVVLYASAFSGLSYIAHQFGVDDQGKFLGKY